MLVDNFCDRKVVFKTFRFVQFVVVWVFPRGRIVTLLAGAGLSWSGDVRQTGTACDRWHSHVSWDNINLTFLRDTISHKSCKLQRNYIIEARLASVTTKRMVNRIQIGYMYQRIYCLCDLTENFNQWNQIRVCCIVLLREEAGLRSAALIYCQYDHW